MNREHDRTEMYELDKKREKLGRKRSIKKKTMIKYFTDMKIIQIEEKKFDAIELKKTRPMNPNI